MILSQVSINDARIAMNGGFGLDVAAMAQAAEAASSSWLGWLRLDVFVGMWPLVVVIASGLLGLDGCATRLIVVIGCPALLLVGLVLALTV